MSIESFLKNVVGKVRLEHKARRAGVEYDSLETDQQEMIKGVVEFSGTTVKEVMVPRVDADFLSSTLSLEEFLEKIAASGHSRFPVYSETIDNVTGIVHVKDVLNMLVRKSDAAFSMEKLLRKPFFVPESKHIDTLLKELRRRRTQIAVVVDEYGGVSGIICMEDIIEEIVGDIRDEFDDEHEDIIKLGIDAWLCDTRINLEDFAQALEVDEPDGEYDTLGGFVYDLFGKIPVKYEKAVWNGIDFIIQDVKGQRINSVKVVKKPEAAAGI
jgi:CBS domain containing-hemolysin-like protein